VLRWRSACTGAPAGTNVTFDIATANGTATAGSDYVAQSLTGQTISAGSSTYSFTVLVNGDTLNEANETFFVNVTNVTNATVADGQGQGTIINDDPPPPILNIDNSNATTKYDAATDGVLLLRYLFGYRDAALVNGALGSGPSLRDATQIAAHVSASLTALDVDGDSKTLALTDGLMILRRLLGLSGAALTANAKQGVASDATIAAAIDALKP